MTLQIARMGALLGVLLICLILPQLMSCSDDCPSCPSPPVEPPEMPKAAFEIIPVNNSFHAMDTLLFDATSSSQGDFGPLAFDWDFGDGSRDSGIMARHVYEEEGQYPISLVVEDSTGASDTCNSLMTIWSPFARAAFNVSITRQDDNAGPRFEVSVTSQLDYYPSGQYFLELEIRTVDGGLVPLLVNRDTAITVSDRYTTSVDTFEYSSPAGFWWPQDSAMLILSLWQEQVGYTRVAIDSLIINYPAVPANLHAEIHTSVSKTGSIPIREFTVTTAVAMENCTSGDYSLVVSVRSTSGEILPIVDREDDFNVAGSSYTDTSVFEYDIVSSLFWPADSAMVISTIWKDISLVSKTRVKSDTLIVGY